MRDLENNRRWQREYRKKHPENKERNRLASMKWRFLNPQRDKELNRRSRDKLKLEVFTHYAKDGIIRCQKCGFDNIDALSLDHIDDTGAQHRRETSGSKMGGINFYKYIRNHGYPENLQLLCMNCNVIKEKLRLRNKTLGNISTQLHTSSTPIKGIKKSGKV